MEFNRGNGFRADLVSETMSTRAFHFIERNITNYYEMILTDKKEATSWSRRLKTISWMWKSKTCAEIPAWRSYVLSRMHLALKAYQELLQTINEMDHSKDKSIRHSSNVIKGKTPLALVGGEREGTLFT